MLRGKNTTALPEAAPGNLQHGRIWRRDPVFGTLTAGRQDSLILDGLGRSDAMAAAPAFSVVGASNAASGTGDTEDARFAPSVQ